MINITLVIGIGFDLLETKANKQIKFDRLIYDKKNQTHSIKIFIFDVNFLNNKYLRNPYIVLRLYLKKKKLFFNLM
jgi:hypothetical protein